MRELILAGDICGVLKKIQELSDSAPVEGSIVYPIENWNPGSVKATDEKRNLETLDAMYHVIKLRGGQTLQGNKLMVSFTKTRLFNNFYKLNCGAELSGSKLPTPKTVLRISDIKGIYREDNHQLRYEVRGNRKLFILNLHRGFPIDYGLPNLKMSNISTAVKDINRISKHKLNIEFKIIDHSDSSSYFINEDCVLIEDQISTVVISDR